MSTICGPTPPKPRSILLSRKKLSALRSEVNVMSSGGALASMLSETINSRLVEAVSGRVKVHERQIKWIGLGWW